MRKGILVLMSLIFLCSAHMLHAQLDGGAFNTTGSGHTVVNLSDYQSLGVNPANLGWQKDGHKMHIGFFEFGMSIYSEPLSKSLVFSDLIGNSSDFTSQYQRDEAVKNFTDTELWIQMQTTLLGVSYQDEKVGGIGFSVKQRLFWNSVLNESASEFMFEGYNSPYFDSISVEPNGDTIGWATNPENASQLYNPTDISHLLFIEYALGYGRKLVDKEDFKFYAGIDFKLLQGFGVMNYNSITPTSVDGYQALSNAYGVKYNEPTPSALTGSGWQTAGMGFGIDVGVSFEIYKKTRVSLALNDIGSIKWDGNVYEGDNVPIKNIETPGIDNYNIFSESGGIIADNTNLGKWEGVLNKTVKLPMNLRLVLKFLYPWVKKTCPEGTQNLSMLPGFSTFRQNGSSFRPASTTGAAMASHCPLALRSALSTTRIPLGKWDLQAGTCSPGSVPTNRWYLLCLVL